MDKAIGGERNVKVDIGGTGEGFCAIRSEHMVEEKRRR
jgi:hypothetical protein